MKRLNVILLIIVLVMTGLQGCTKDKNQNTDKGQSDLNTKSGQTQADSVETGTSDPSPEMGRYMETKVKLPELGENETIVGILQNPAAQIEVYTMSNKGKIEYLCYTLGEGMTWEKSSPEWLNDGSQSSQNRTITFMCYGENGYCYALCNDYSGVSKSFIIMTEDGGKTSKNVDIPYLNENVADADENTYPYVISLQVLENGSLVLYDLWDDTSLLVFSEAGEKLYSVPIQSEQNYKAFGNDIIVASKDGKGIMIYDAEKNEPVRTVEYNLSINPTAYTMNKAGVLYLGDSTGIHRLPKDATLWETIVDGALNSMSMPSLTFIALYETEGEQEEYYAVYSDADNGYQLMHYAYDKNVTSVPEKEITVYSLVENRTIRQAISLYQSRNADIKINYIVAMNNEDENASDYIRALNAELMAGKGADIIVLDGLPIDSYIEKGILADISGCVKPLEDSSELMTNISNCYHIQDKMYSMPIRFMIPIIAGKKDAVNSIGSMDTVVSYINKSGKPFMDSTNYSGLLENCLALYSDDLFQDGKLVKDKFLDFLNNIKIIAAFDNPDISKNSDSEVQKSSLAANSMLQYNVISLLENYDASITKMTNLYDSMLMFSILNKNSLSCSSINRMFIPMGTVGINNAGQNIDLAKDFLGLLLSQEVQNSNVNDGFPVNQKSLLDWMAKENKDISVAVGTKDGDMVYADWPAKKDRDSLLDIAESLNKPIEENQVLHDMLVTEILPYLEGKTDAKQVEASLESKINIYLAEQAN